MVVAWWVVWLFLLWVYWVFDGFCFVFLFFLILGFWFRWVWSAEGSGGVVVIVCLVVEQVRERLGVHEQCFNTHRSSESSRTV